MTTWTLIVVLTGSQWAQITVSTIPGYQSKATCEEAVERATAVRRVEAVAWCIPGPR